MRLSEKLGQFAMRYAPDDPVLGPPPPGQFAAWSDEASAIESALAKAARALEHDKEWLDEFGCDCGTDEPGTCAWCENKRALSDPFIAAAAKEADE